MHVFLICLSSICYDDTLGGTLYKFQHFLRYTEKPCDRSYRYTRVLSKRGYMFCHVFFVLFLFFVGLDKSVLSSLVMYILRIDTVYIYVCQLPDGNRHPHLCVYTTGEKWLAPQKKKKKKKKCLRRKDLFLADVTPLCIFNPHRLKKRAAFRLYIRTEGVYCI